MPDNNPITLTSVISTALRIPGIRVDREAFLREQFKSKEPEALSSILAFGPVAAGCDRDTLRGKADKVILETTLTSTGVSFLAGLPGGLAMAATIPADILQFYCMALKMAQEIAYIYGEQNLFTGDAPDEERVTNQLILYCGVMLGTSGSAQAVRLTSSALARQAIKDVPPKIRTDTFYYPVIRQVLRFFAKTLTKTSIVKGVSKAIPVIGGVVSGGITFASLRPMGNRLKETFDKAHFSYSDIEIRNDIRDLEEEIARAEQEEADEAAEEAEPAAEEPEIPEAGRESAPGLDEIRQAKQLLDDGVIDEKEFAEIKARIISRM